MSPSDLAFMDDIFVPTAQLEPEPMQTMEPELIFIDPFAKRPSVQLNLPDLQALKDFIGGESVNPMEYTLHGEHSMGSFQSFSSASMSQSPLSSPLYGGNPLRVSISMPTSHCCYTLAYSTLESLRIISADATHAYPSLELKSLDSVLSITKLAVQSISQLLNCPCSSDPHLAMLYSSITSKIITWYQIAAGVNVTATSATSTSPSIEGSSRTSSPSTSAFPSPLPTPSLEQDLDSDLQTQALRCELYAFDAGEQQRLRRQVVLCELTKCAQLVDVLANWSSDGQTCEQAEFLYDVLGAWLKSELFKTMREVESLDAF